MISKEIKFLLTHSSIYGLGTIISRAVSFLLLPLYTRYLTPADYGILEAIDITTAMIGFIVTVGIARALSRFYYNSEIRAKKNLVVSTTFITYMVIGLGFLPFLIVCSPFFANILLKSSEYGLFLKISFGSLLAGGLVDIAMMYLRLEKKPITFVSLTIIRLFLLIILNILFIVYYKMGVIGILYSSLIVRTIYALFLTSAILYKTKINFSLVIAREILKYSLPMIPSDIANTAVKQSDKYFVLYLMSVSDMGIYSLALKIGNAIHSLLTIPFNMVYIPRRFELMKGSDAREIYRRVFTYYFFFITYIGLIISVFIPEILNLMVSEQFRSAANIIPLVALSNVILGCHYHFDFGILFSKKTKYLAYINICCAVLNLGLNYSLIKMFGLFGAVWSAIIILSFQAILLYYFSNKFFYINYEFSKIFRYIFTAIFIYIISYEVQTKSTIINISFKMFNVFILFPTAQILLKTFNHYEINKAKALFLQKLHSLVSKKHAVKMS